MKISSTLGRDGSKLNVINGCMGKRAWLFPHSSCPRKRASRKGAEALDSRLRGNVDIAGKTGLTVHLLMH